MGYEIERFVSEIDDEFCCSICAKVLENPMQSPCEHTFCNNCIKEWLTDKTSCPVDSCVLAFDEIKPTPRYFRNMLGKIEIKCNFEPKGCQAIVPLEQLQRHLTECDFDVNADVFCAKDCNNKISKLSEEIERQREEITKLTDKISQQLEEKTTLTDEITRSANVIQRQQVDIMKYCGDVRLLLHQTMEVVDKLSVVENVTPKWQICENMKTSIDQPRILEHGRRDLEAFAQLTSSLEPSNSSFKVKVLNVQNNDIVIGLTRRGYPTGTPPGYSDTSVGFCSFGHIFVNGRRMNIGQQWGNDDIVECGIKFPNNFTNNGKTNVEIYFAINEQIMFNEIMKLPHDGFFPTVYMWNIACEAPKVEILN